VIVLLVRCSWTWCRKLLVSLELLLRGFPYLTAQEKRLTRWSLQEGCICCQQGLVHLMHLNASRMSTSLS
jgi:hypothetical protein